LKREVLIHREYLYEQFQESQNEYVDQNQPLDQDYVSLLQEMDLQIVIIGGFPKFVQKWREAFPKIRIVGERDYHLTLNFLNKMDVIVFDAQYNNHSNFERVMAAFTSEEPVFQMVRRTRSVDLLCKDIYYKLQDHKQKQL
jgi:sRNA-binding carbon storage regulator CsrA